MEFNPTIVTALIRTVAASQGVDPDLAVAIAAHESNLNPLAVRIESKWKYYFMPETFAKKLEITVETEMALQAMSWNVMQVMGSVARELGFVDSLQLLIEPNIGILYGCKKLKKLFATYKDEESVIASYNAGSPRSINGKFENQAYVDDVKKRLMQLRANMH